MVETCAVTIDIRDFGMEPSEGATVTISSPSPRLSVKGNALVLFEPQTFTVPTSGQIVVAIRPGPILVEVSGQQVSLQGRAVVPDQASAFLAQWMDAAEIAPIPASLQAVTDARAARDAAQGFAADAEGSKAQAAAILVATQNERAAAEDAAADAEAYASAKSDVLFGVGDNPDGYSYDVLVPSRLIVGESPTGAYPSVTVEVEDGDTLTLLKGSAAVQIVLDRDAAAASSTAAAASATAAAASATAAAASATAAAASVRLDVATFAELATAFGYTSAGGRRAAAAGDGLRVIDLNNTYRVAASGASDAHLDFTGSGGVKLYVLPSGGRMQWRAFGPTFDTTTNNSALFQVAASAASAAGVPLIVDGPFALRSAVTVPNRVTILAHDATIHDPDNLALIVDLQGAGSRWEGGTFVGYETYAQFQAAVPSSMSQAQSCIRLSGAGSQVIGVSATNKKNTVRITASGCRAERVNLTGYFPDVVLSGATITGANYLPAVYFEGVQSGWAVNCTADHAGSVVLWGLDSNRMEVEGCTGAHLWDNGIYGSSGNDGLVRGCAFEDVYGTGVKMRGSRNRAVDNRSTRCGTGISLTGNGVTPDSRGANGFGNMAIGNIDVDSYSYPISCGIQDGLYQRDLTIANNVSINGSTRGAGFSLSIIALGGVTITGNTFVDHKGTTAAMIVTAPAGSEVLGGTISGNTMIGGASEGMRLTSMRGVAVTGNSGRGNAQALCEWRNVNECSFVGNVCEDQNVFEWSSSFPGTGCVVGDNVGNQAASAALRATNLFTPGIGGGTHLVASIASAPAAVGQEAWVSSILYRSVGTASTADWVRVN